MLFCAPRPSLKTPPRSHLFTLLLLLCGLFTGCVDGDDEVNLPFVEVFSPTTTQSGEVELEYRVRDRDRNVNVFPELLEGSFSRTATQSPNSDPTADVFASVFGESYFFRWDSYADLGAGVHENVVLRFTVVGREGVGEFPGFSTGLTVDNSDGFDEIESNLEIPNRQQPVVATLPDSRVFTAFGTDPNGQLSPLSFIFEPQTRLFLEGPVFAQARVNASAARTPQGALVLGGRSQGNLVATAEMVVLEEANTEGRIVAQGNLVRPREHAQTITLDDGRVVVIGGQDDAGLVDELEIFDAGSFQSLATDPLLARRNALLLPLSDGRLLLCGGFDAAGNALNTAAFISINGTTVTVQATAGTLNSARGRLSGVELSSGQVVLVGGASNDTAAGALDSIEIFTPSIGQFSLIAAPMADSRIDPAVLVDDDIVIIAGGRNQSDQGATVAERFDISQGQFEATRFPQLGALTEVQVRELGTGQFLLMGGGQPQIYIPTARLSEESFRTVGAVQPALSEAEALVFVNEIFLFGGRDHLGLVDEVYVQVIPNAITNIRGNLLLARTEHQIQGLPTTQVLRFVLVAGGLTNAGVTNDCEIFDLTTGQSTVVSPMNVARRGHRMVLLEDRRIFVAGGRDATGQALSSCEVYDPFNDVWTLVGDMSSPRADFVIDNNFINGLNKVFIAGGVDATNTPLNTAEFFDPSTDTFRVALNTMSQARTRASLAFDSSGIRHAVVGGSDGSGPSMTLDIINLFDERFEGTLGLTFAREGGQSILLGNGSATTLLVGGTDANGRDVPPEIVDFTLGGLNGMVRIPQDPTMLRVRRRATVAAMGTTGFIIGGLSPRGVFLSGTERFLP